MSRRIQQLIHSILRWLSPNSFSVVETCEIMEESSPGFKSSDSFPALLNRFRQHLLISISTNKFPFYSLFSSLAGQWSSVRNSPQDFGRFSQIMSRSPRCDISTEISHSGYKVHDRAHCDKYSGKSSWSLDRDSAVVQPHWCKVRGGNLCGREDKSKWQGRQILCEHPAWPETQVAAAADKVPENFQCSYWWWVFTTKRL